MPSCPRHACHAAHAPSKPAVDLRTAAAKVWSVSIVLVRVCMKKNANASQLPSAQAHTHTDRGREK